MYQINQLVKFRYIPFDMFGSAEDIVELLLDDILAINDTSARKDIMDDYLKFKRYFISSCRVLCILSEEEYMVAQLEPESWLHTEISLSDFHSLHSDIIKFEGVIAKVREILASQ